MRPVAFLAVAIVVASAPFVTGESTVLNVANVAPVVVSVTLPSATITPSAGTTTSVATTVVVEDVNGHNDVTSVTVEILKPDGTRHVAPAAATRTSGAELQATYSFSFSMQYHDAPALATDTYKVKIVATDSQGATGDNLASLAVFNYAELAAVGLGSDTVDFATLEPGAASDTRSVAVLNRGNVATDVTLAGTALVHATEAASIPVGAVSYATTSNMSDAAALSTSAATLAAFDLPRGASSSKDLYWRVTTPSGDAQWIPSGDYSGTLTIGAIKG